jgi:hypothetical protein
MKYILIYFATLLLLIPPVILGVCTFLWTPSKKGFLKGSQFLDEKWNYGTVINNLINQL